MYDEENEIIVPYPKAKLLENAVEELNTNSQLEAVLQGLCSAGSVDEIWVEEKDGEVSVSWTESVHSGCKDLEFTNNHEIELSYEFREDGMRFFIRQSALLIRTKSNWETLEKWRKEALETKTPWQSDRSI